MNIREQIKQDIEKQVSGMVGRWDGGIRGLVSRKLEIEITRTADAKNGDYSTNAALKLAGSHRVKEPKESKKKNSDSSHSPLDFANFLADNLGKQPYIEKVEVAGPGFVNIFVKPEFWQDEVENVLKEGQKYGGNKSNEGKKARVEFVSANPTGPLHFGNARGGPIGDTLARVLEASGYEVLREYYHNDVGVQVTKLGQSIWNVAAGQKLEDQEYKGEYIRELADKFSGQIRSAINPDVPVNSINTALLEKLGKEAVDQMLDETLADCEAMGIKFDKVFSESGFVSSGDTEREIAELDKKGFIKEKDGAKWFAPNDEFLKDRETVVVKSDGSYTYFSNDIAYHKIKFSEGYDLVVDIFGANHHGHVPRLQAVIKALGGDVSQFHVILYQWVRFKKGGQVLAMSKRSGNFITAKEILEMVGPDAVRFFVLMHDPNSHIDFDLDLAKEKSNKNPVFYVQYAHARIASILAKTKDEGLKTKADLTLLSTEFELALVKKISKLPELVEDISVNFGVNGLTTYATELADTFHKFYENCRVLPSEDEGAEKVTEELTRARLALVEATKITLANTLNLLGISAPEKM